MGGSKQFNHSICQVLSVSPDGSIIKLLRLPPFANASQAEDVIALLENAKSTFTDRLFLHDHIHADSTCLLDASLRGQSKQAIKVHCNQTNAYLDGERKFHLLLVLSNALLE
jgi:hypothetical protein